MKSDVITQYVENVIGSPECEMCKNKEWLVADEENLQTVYLPVSEYLFGIITKDRMHLPFGYSEGVHTHLNSVDVIPLTCSKCGNTKIINKLFIEKWVAKSAR